MAIPSPQWLSSYVTVGSFTPPLVTAVQTFAGNILLAGEVLCGLEQNNPVKTGCNDSSNNNNAGSGNSSSSGSGANTSQTTPAANVADGKVGSCSLGNKLCGTGSCIPSRTPFVARMSDLTAIVRPAMSAPRMEPAKWPLPITPPAPIYRAPSVSHRLTVAARPMLPPTNAMAPARSLPLRIPAAPLPTSLLPCPRLWNTAKSVSSPPKSTMPLPAV